MPRGRTPSRGRAMASKKSPASSRSRSRGRKSPARTKSPARAGRSPARAAKSPARATRSPTRATKSPARSSASPARVTRSRSPARVNAAPPPPRDSPKAAAKETTTPPSVRSAAASAVLTSTPKSEVRARRPITRTAPETATSPVVEERPAPAPRRESKEGREEAPQPPPAATIGTRHSARIANKLKELGIDPAAGGDTLKDTAAQEEPLKKANTASWGKVLLSPLVLVIAVVPFYLYSACNRKQCSIGRLPEVPRALRLWLDPTAFALVAGYLTAHLLFALVPLGRVVEGQISKRGIARYRCNGFLSLVAAVSGLLLAHHLQLPVLTALARLRLLLVAAAALAGLLALLLHVRARRAHLLDINPSGDTDSLIINLLAGRELSPRLLGVDLKLLLVRASCVAAVLLAVLMVLSERAARAESSPTLLVAAGMVTLFAADHMWFEDNVLTTYEFMNEGLGLRQLLTLMMFPFYAVFNLRFIMVTGVSQPWYALVGCVMLFLVGYLIHRSSNSQKNEFRKNPVNPALAHLETIPTTKGKKLLVSGWWGVVRHPNHLGDLLIINAMALLLGFHHGLAWVLPVFFTLCVLLHVRQLDRHCAQKYGAAWQRYVDRVRHSVIPSVY